MSLLLNRDHYHLIFAHGFMKDFPDPSASNGKDYLMIKHDDKGKTETPVFFGEYSAFISRYFDF